MARMLDSIRACSSLSGYRSSACDKIEHRQSPTVVTMRAYDLRWKCNSISPYHRRRESTKVPGRLTILTLPELAGGR